MRRSTGAHALSKSGRGTRLRHAAPRAGVSVTSGSVVGSKAHQTRPHGGVDTAQDRLQQIGIVAAELLRVDPIGQDPSVLGLDRVAPAGLARVKEDLMVAGLDPEERETRFAPG